MRYDDCPDRPGHPCDSAGCDHPEPTAAPWNQDAWEARGKELAKCDSDTYWQLGDWLLEGINQQGWDESGFYYHAEKLTAIPYGRLRDLASTAKRVPLSARTDKKSWTHHRIIVNSHKDGEPELTPEQIKGWLDRAVAEDWSTRELQVALAGDPPQGVQPKPIQAEITVELPWSVYFDLQYLALANAHYDKKRIGKKRFETVRNEDGDKEMIMRRAPVNLVTPTSVGKFAAEVLTKLLETPESKGTIRITKLAWTISDEKVKPAKKHKKPRRYRMSKRERIADASAAVANLPEPAPAPELPELDVEETLAKAYVYRSEINKEAHRRRRAKSAGTAAALAAEASGADITAQQTAYDSAYEKYLAEHPKGPSTPEEHEAYNEAFNKRFNGNRTHSKADRAGKEAVARLRAEKKHEPGTLFAPAPELEEIEQ